VKGSANVLDAISREIGAEAGETTRDGMFSLEVVACMGACGLAPVVNVAGDYHAGVTPGKVRKILDAYRRKASEDDADEAHD
jgi:NADH:ubiquinone oxidoreductase subunit E